MYEELDFEPFPNDPLSPLPPTPTQPAMLVLQDLDENSPQHFPSFDDLYRDSSEANRQADSASKGSQSPINYHDLFGYHDPLTPKDEAIQQAMTPAGSSSHGPIDIDDLFKGPPKPAESSRFPIDIDDLFGGPPTPAESSPQGSRSPIYPLEDSIPAKGAMRQTESSTIVLEDLVERSPSPPRDEPPATAKSEQQALPSDDNFICYSPDSDVLETELSKPAKGPSIIPKARKRRISPIRAPNFPKKP